MSKLAREIHRHPTIQLLGLAVFAWLAWSWLHLPRHIPKDVVPYLTSLPQNVVFKCQQEGNTLYPGAWADLLAIRTTLPESSAEQLTKQLTTGITFKRLTWSTIASPLRQSIIRKRIILRYYPFYQPSRYVFPVVGYTWYSDTFGADREGGKRQHQGTDLFAGEGTPLISASNGRVERLGWNRLGGERVGVRGDDGNYYYYAHLAQISPALVLGKKIKKGDPIGTMGHTGDAITTPDHLHFGIELANGQWINPYPFLVIWQYYRHYS